MGLLSKLKDALFEEEYVEVEEKPKKEKKVKPNKVEEKNNNSKPIAKKIVLPGREERVEEIEEEELRDEDFEIRPKDDIVKKKVLEEVEEELEEPKLRPQTPEFLMMDDDDDYKVKDDYVISEDKEPIKEEFKEEVVEEKEPYVDKYRDERYSYYQTSRPSDREHMPYGIKKDEVRVQDYGLYEKKEEKSGFKPSPIISPIYGILDKNYRKEDVVQKREVRLTSSYARGNVSIEDVRKKAYGSLSDDIEREIEEDINEKVEPKEEVKVEETVNDAEEENLLVDLSEDKDKPFVKDVTMGDALEYYSDLGLEYNVDYMDASKEKASGRRVKEEPKEAVVEEESLDEPKLEVIKEENTPEVEEKTEVVEEKQEETPTLEVEEDKKEDTEAQDTDDNLFDLIDSMYQEED